MEVRKQTAVPKNLMGMDGKRKYPFHELEVNDVLTFSDTQQFERARRAAQGYAKTHGVRFTSRKGFQINENDEAVHAGSGGIILRIK